MANSFRQDIIVIGASMGGVEALSELVSHLPSDLSATIFIVVHVHPQSPRMLAKILSSRGPLTAKFAERGEAFYQGNIYIAPPNAHLIVKPDTIALSQGPRENRSRPAIDVLFRSAAVTHTTRVIGVLLTGLLDDGTSGLEAIKRCGGIAVVQDPDDAAYSEMPESALASVDVDYCAKLEQIPAIINQLVREPAKLPDPVPQELIDELKFQESASMINMKMLNNGNKAPVVCPDCGGTLTELKSGKLIKYRCHTGHAYSPLTLFEGHSEAVEHSLWAAIRALEEKVKLAERLGNTENKSIKASYDARAAEAKLNAEHIKRLLMK
jgi:two-component system chemotaxis response regulator CheB